MILIIFITMMIAQHYCSLCNLCIDGYVLFLGLGKNTGSPVYHGISLAWYVPWHTCPYRGILVFLFLVTENLKSKKLLTDLKFKQLQVKYLQLETIEFNLKMVILGVLGTR